MISYTSVPIFFGGYALDVASYALNWVPIKARESVGTSFIISLSKKCLSQNIPFFLKKKRVYS